MHIKKGEDVVLQHRTNVNKPLVSIAQVMNNNKVISCSRIAVSVRVNLSSPVTATGICLTCF